MITAVWRQITRGVHVLTRRRDADRDLDDEVQHYIAQTVTELIAAGRSPADARRLAIMQFGNATVTREQVRGYGWENVVDSTITDLRYSARRLRNSVGFTTVTAVTLALGIGATAAVFSVVNPILLEPLPYPDAHRVVSISDRAADGSRADVTFGSYREILARSRSFDALAVMRPWQPTVSGGGEPERLDGQRVTASYFRVLGVPPAIGRDFDDSFDVPGAPNVVLLGAGLWRRRFGGDSAIIGQPVLLDGISHVVIGVMPGELENVLAPTAELWTPLKYDRALPVQGREWGHHLRMIGRLRTNASVEQAARELGRIAAEPIPEFARVTWASLTNGLATSALHADVTREARPALLAILGAVVLVLVIACVNVTNLLLGRSVQRRAEIAMRTTLGASRPRVVRQLVTETLVLAVIGGALGMLVAQTGVRTLVALSPAELPRLNAIRLDGDAFAFAALLTTLIGLAIGAIPAVQLTRGPVDDRVRSNSRTVAGSHRFVRSALVVAEVSLALVLLVGAGLLLRSVHRLLAVAPGFDSSGVLAMQVQTAGPRFAEDGATQRFFTAALRAAREVPGVVSAGFTSQLPLTGDVDRYGAQFEGVADAREDRGVFTYGVSPGYLETMRIPRLSGRSIDDRDLAGAPVSVLVSQSLARRMFPGRTAIGQRLHVGSTDQPWYTIVGVVGDVRQASLAESNADAVYIPDAQWYVTNRAMWLVVRATGDAARLAPAIRRAIWSVDKDQPIARVASMDELVAVSTSDRRFTLIVLEMFAVAALVLAATGIYGVLAGGVAERTREIGVRVALGATSGAILRMVVRHGLALTALGVAIGLAGAVAASRALGSLLFGVTPRDTATYVGTTALLFVVAAAACWIPAWRAARVDPAITLRTE